MASTSNEVATFDPDRGTVTVRGDAVGLGAAYVTAGYVTLRTGVQVQVATPVRVIYTVVRGSGTTASSIFHVALTYGPASLACSSITITITNDGSNLRQITAQEPAIVDEEEDDE